MKQKLIQYVHPAFEDAGKPEVKWRELPANRHGFKDVEFYVELQGHMIVCPECGGHGVHERRDIDCSRIVDMYLEDGDYDGLENYYSGAYDVLCTRCNGNNVIFAPDWESAPEWVEKCIRDWEDAEADSRAEQEAERRMGA